MKTATHEKRKTYLALATEGLAQLCSFCKFAEFSGGSVCSGESYPECQHPLNDRLGHWNSEPEPGDDCWGFRPTEPIEIVADIVGLLLKKEGSGASWVKRKNGTYAVYIAKEV